MGPNEQLNSVLLRLQKRAETVDREKLLETFVDVGPLLNILSSPDHQVIYGRRGTGKTHALIYLSEARRKEGDFAVYVDMRNIGSTGGIYADPSLPLSERATRLLSDTLSAIHDALVNHALEREPEINLGQLGSLLDTFADAITEVSVVGPVTEEVTHQERASSTNETRLDLSAATKPKASFGISSATTREGTSHTRALVAGERRHRVHFGAVATTLSRIMTALAPKRVWLLLDEWSVVPLDLQPYLADLIRRSVLPVRGLTVKIGAIDQRTILKIDGGNGEYIGIELGADVGADLNLDDFMVFDNDEARATIFFRDLLFRHFSSIAAEKPFASAPASPAEFVQMAFTQRTVFDELVRSAEGVPRDAMYVIALSAQRATSEPIAVNHVRLATKTWYQRGKESSVAANTAAHALLHWIIDEVIAHRRARAFLLQSGVRNPLVDALFDARVLHVLKRNISAHDQPGVRYDSYKIDYGCYVDLMTTARAPQGLLPFDDPDKKAEYVQVPPDDYRAIRRAILDLAAFEQSWRERQGGAV